LKADLKQLRLIKDLSKTCQIVNIINVYKEINHMAKPLLKGMEGVFIPVKDPELSAKWYEEILGFKLCTSKKRLL
jgi:hypothetical protein